MRPAQSGAGLRVSNRERNSTSDNGGFAIFSKTAFIFG